jgi:hypothetical protein
VEVGGSKGKGVTAAVKQVHEDFQVCGKAQRHKREGVGRGGEIAIMRGGEGRRVVYGDVCDSFIHCQIRKAAVARVRALPYDLLDVEARRFEEEDYGRVFKVSVSWCGNRSWWFHTGGAGCVDVVVYVEPHIYKWLNKNRTYAHTLTTTQSRRGCGSWTAGWPRSSP